MFVHSEDKDIIQKCNTLPDNVVITKREKDSLENMRTAGIWHFVKQKQTNKQIITAKNIYWNLAKQKKKETNKKNAGLETLLKD